MRERVLVFLTWLAFAGLVAWLYFTFLKIYNIFGWVSFFTIFSLVVAVGFSIAFFMVTVDATLKMGDEQ